MRGGDDTVEKRRVRNGSGLSCGEKRDVCVYVFLTPSISPLLSSDRIGH